MSTKLDRLNWYGKAKSSTPVPSLIRQPARIATVAGAVMIIIGCISAWATGIDGNGIPQSFGANDGTADGVFLIVGALLIIAVTLNRGWAESTSRTVQLTPLFTTLVQLIIWSGGLRSANIVIQHWVATGGTGSLAMGIWLAFAGIVIAAAGSAWIYVRRPAAIREATPSIVQEWGITGWGAAEAAAAMIGAAVGAIGGLVIAVALFGTLGVLIMVILCTLGFVFGMQVGVQAVRTMERRRAP